MHAADAASLELAAYVARRIGPLRLLLVLTRRPFPRGERVDALVTAVRARQVSVAEIDLVPLGHREMGELVRAVATLDDRGVDRVVAVADGNPLLAIEAARAVRDGAEGPPPGLRAAVRAATAALPPDARRLAEVAAVAGGDLNAAELDMLTTGDALAQALDSGLFTGRDGRFGYHHALLREAAYDDLPGPRRAELHAEYAVACNGAAAERAHHWRRAGRHDLAVAELARAADNAWAVSALDAAAAFLREAVELAPDDAQLWLRLAETEAWRGLRMAAHVAFDRALERIDRRDTRRLAEAWIGRAKWSRGSLCDPLGVIDAARRGIDLLGELGEHDSAVAMEAAASLSWSEAVGGDVAEAPAGARRDRRRRAAGPARPRPRVRPRPRAGGRRRPRPPGRRRSPNRPCSPRGPAGPSSRGPPGSTARARPARSAISPRRSRSSIAASPRSAASARCSCRRCPRGRSSSAAPAVTPRPARPRRRSATSPCSSLTTARSRWPSTTPASSPWPPATGTRLSGTSPWRSTATPR